MWDRTGKRKYLNRRERKLFLRAARLEGDPKKEAFCLVLLYSGCRISEALELAPDCVDFEEGALVLRTLKRRKESHSCSVPVPKGLIKPLQAMVSSAGEEGMFRQY